MEDARLSALEEPQLLELLHQGHPDAFSELAGRYITLLQAKARSVAGPGAPEREDLLQEGMLGLYLAATTYRPDGGASFRTYAGVCVRNRMADAVRRHQGPGNRPLNESLSLDAEEAALPAGKSLEELLELQERTRLLARQMEQSLTPLERRALELLLAGCPRQEVETRGGMTLKAYDNALYRVRQKLRQETDE